MLFEVLLVLESGFYASRESSSHLLCRHLLTLIETFTPFKCVWDPLTVNVLCVKMTMKCNITHNETRHERRGKTRLLRDYTWEDRRSKTRRPEIHEHTLIDEFKSWEGRLSSYFIMCLLRQFLSLEIELPLFTWMTNVFLVYPLGFPTTEQIAVCSRSCSSQDTW